LSGAHPSSPERRGRRSTPSFFGSEMNCARSALFHPPLKSQLGPGVKLRAGELIGVTYEGMAKSRLTDRHYHNYKIAREDEVSPDEPLSDVPSDWDGAAPPTPAPVPVGGPVDERDDDIPF